MDISSLYGSSALDSTAYTNAANQTASKLQDKLNSSDYSKATDDELMDACKQFESYFLEQMFKEMMKTIPESEDTSSSNSQLMDYYKDEWYSRSHQIPQSRTVWDWHRCFMSK
mgnify:CR=1 FL=1